MSKQRHVSQSRQRHGGRDNLLNPRTVTGAMGQCGELGENIFSIGHVYQADRFVKTADSILSYIQSRYDYGKDVAWALKHLKDYDFVPEMPKAPAASSSQDSKILEMILNQEVREYVNRKTKYQDNMSKAYALIHGQCTTGLKNKLESRKDWENIENNTIELLKAI